MNPHVSRCGIRVHAERAPRGIRLLDYLSPFTSLGTLL